MDIILISDSVENVHPIMNAAERAACRVIKQIGPDDQASSYIKKLHPDALVVISDDMDRTILRELHTIKDNSPLPVLIFTRDADPYSIEAAVKAGASSYIIDCHDPDRLKPLLDVAKTRFAEQRRIEDELDDTRQALVDRKKVDKAKGILMKQKSLDEGKAYKMMRDLAMSHNKKMGEMAEQIILASELLAP